MNDYKTELSTLSSRYVIIHRAISSVLDRISELAIEKDMLSKELLEIRETERKIINNLEKELGREVTADDLRKIMQDA